MQMVAMLKQSQTVKNDATAAQLSLEMRDSLNTILLSAELLAHPYGQLDSEQRQEYCQYIYTAVQQLVELLEMRLET